MTSLTLGLVTTAVAVAGTAGTTTPTTTTVTTAGGAKAAAGKVKKKAPEVKDVDMKSDYSDSSANKEVSQEV